MSTATKTKIDHTVRDDMVMCEGLAEFLYLLIDSDPFRLSRITITSYIDGDFCPTCAEHADNCECDPERYTRDYDYDYDNWVDRQMEEQAND